MSETTPQYINGLENRLKKHIDDNFAKVDERFDKVNNRFDKVNNRFDKVDKRFDKIEETLNKHNKKLDTHFETIGALKVQVTGIDTRVKSIEKVMFVS
jgi:DNA anti-recombination protein RmuC